jgi:hypothetical protein
VVGGLDPGLTNQQLSHFTTNTEWNLRQGWTTGLPDGTFPHQKFQIGCFMEGHGMENVGTLYGRLEYCVVVWYN